MTRSYLYVPADRPDELRGAFDAGADAIVADLHEGLAYATKDESRRNTVSWLDGAPPPGGDSPECWVRINSDDRTIGDLDAVVHPRLAGIVLPRATLSRLGDLEETIAYLENDRGVESRSTRIEATIDSAQGVLDAVALANHPRVDRLAAGEADLTAELGVKPTASGHGLWPLRMQLVVASAATAIAAPVGPAHTDRANLANLRSTSQELAAAGFGARPAIDTTPVSYTHLTLPTRSCQCRSRWSAGH